MELGSSPYTYTYTITKSHLIALFEKVEINNLNIIHIKNILKERFILIIIWQTVLGWKGFNSTYYANTDSNS